MHALKAIRLRLWLLLAFTLRLLWLGGASLWYDEAYVWWAASRLPFSRLVALSQYDILPPLHTLVLRLWIPLAGRCEFALRYPTLLMGVLAVAAGMGLARRLGGRRAAMRRAALLFALAPPLFWAAREARLYGFAVTLTLLGDVALLDYLTASPSVRRRFAWIWAGLVLLSAYTVVTSAFWFVGQFLFLAVMVGLQRRPLHRVVAELLPPFTVAGLLYLPWLVGTVPHLHDNATYWPGYLAPATFWRTARDALTTFGYGPSFVIPIVLGAFGVALLSLSLHLGDELRHRAPPRALYLLTMALPILVQMVSYRHVPKLSMRHLILFAPLVPLAIALAPELLSGSLRRLASWSAMGLALLLLPAVLAILGRPGHADWRSVAAYVAAHRSPEDVVIIETGSTFPTWLYYADEEGLLPLPPDDLLHIDHILTYGPTVDQLRRHLPPPGASVWVVEWLAPVTDPTALVPALLSRVGQEQPLPRFDGIGLRRFLIEEGANFPPEPPLTRRVEAEFLPALHLIGYEARPPLRRDRPLDLWLWWRTDDPTVHAGRFPQLVLRLLDGADVEWGRVNGTPGGGDFRPERWPVDEPILGRQMLEPLPWTPPGRYRLVATVCEGEREATVELGTVALSTGEAQLSLPQEATRVDGPEAAPLTLRGFALGRRQLAPCEPLEGMLFWEAIAVPEPLPLLTMTLGSTLRALPPLASSAMIGEAGVDFATRFVVPVDCRAVTGELPLTAQCCGQRWPLPAVQVVADRTFTLPEEVEPLSVTFGTTFATLAGYRLTPASPRAGQPFTLTLYWRAGQTTEQPYSVFVHLLDAQGAMVAQADAWPQEGKRPTPTWAEGEIIADPYPIAPLPAGRYRVAVGLYGADGQRLPTPQGDEAVWMLDVLP